MSKAAIKRFCLFLTFFFALACCASVPQGSDSSRQPDEAAAEPERTLRLVFSAGTKGYYEPCPT